MHIPNKPGRLQHVLHRAGGLLTSIFGVPGDPGSLGCLEYTMGCYLVSRILLGLSPTRCPQTSHGVWPSVQSPQGYLVALQRSDLPSVSGGYHSHGGSPCILRVQGGMTDKREPLEAPSVIYQIPCILCGRTIA